MEKSSEFIYSGYVKVTIKGKSIISHNDGFEPLFRLFADAVCGENITSPNYIMLVNESNTELLKVKVLAVKLSTSKEIDGVSSPVAAIKAVIRYDTIISEPSGDKVFVELRDFNNNVFARSEIPNNILNITAGEQAIIEWILSISNKEAE